MQNFGTCKFRAVPTYRMAASSRYKGAQPSGVVVVAASYSSATPPAKPLSFVLQGSQFYAPPRMAPVAAPNGSARSGRRWARPSGGPGYPHLIPVTPHKGQTAFLCDHRADRTRSASQVAPARAHGPGNTVGDRLVHIDSETVATTTPENRERALGHILDFHKLRAR